MFTDSFDTKNGKGTLKSGYERVDFLGCFSYNRVGKLAIIHNTFKSEQCVNIV